MRSRLAPTVRTLPKGILGVTHFPPARIVGTNHKVKRVGQGFGASASDSFRPTLAMRRRLTGSPNRNVVRSLPTLSGEDPLNGECAGTALDAKTKSRAFRLALLVFAGREDVRGKGSMPSNCHRIALIHQLFSSKGGNARSISL